MPQPIATLPPPPQLLDLALEERMMGNDEASAEILHSYLNTYPNASEERQARYYLAESFAKRSRWTSAAETFKTLIDEPDTLTAPALFWLARCYEEAGDHANAIATYQRYRLLNTPLEPYAAMRQAAQYRVINRLTEAAQTYEHVATSTVQPAERAGSYEKAIALHHELGDTTKMLQLYTDLLELASLPDYRSRMLHEAVTLATQMGKQEQGQVWQDDLLTNYPTSSYALAIVEASIESRRNGDSNIPPIAPAIIAQVLYYADKHTEATPYFDQAAQQIAAGEPTTATLDFERLRAINIRETGYFTLAMAALEPIFTRSPNSVPGRQARLDWIQTLGQKGETRQAAEAYQAYAASYPDDSLAPIALDRAAQLLDRLGAYEDALKVRIHLEQTYPETSFTPYILHDVALARYRNGTYDAAQTLWQYIAMGRKGYLHALGSYWAARSAQGQQQSTQAQTLFTDAYTASPDSYYGARAAEHLNLSAQPTHAIDNPITEDDWRTLADWVAGWEATPQPPLTMTDQITAPHVLHHATVQRAIGLDQVGLYSDAIAEWNYARQLWQDTPSDLVRLVYLAHTHNNTYIALKIAEQLAAAAPSSGDGDGTASMPAVLRRLIYPTPYTQIVQEQAQTYGVDPLLLYALMRQESLFNPHATSWVGARGLGQVMPTTGSGIARQLHISPFSVDDLYRPAVSIQFAAYYIAQQITMMHGSIQAGLAAYNGGPGNAMRWAGGDHVDDADIFTEIIDYPETQNYVKRVYGYYKAYQRLYTVPE